MNLQKYIDEVTTVLEGYVEQGAFTEELEFQVKGLLKKSLLAPDADPQLRRKAMNLKNLLYEAWAGITPVGQVATRLVKWDG